MKYYYELSWWLLQNGHYRLEALMSPLGIMFNRYSPFKWKIRLILGSLRDAIWL